MKTFVVLFLLITNFPVCFGQRSMGFSFTNKGKEIIVTRVILKSPADKAGIKDGDIILTLDDKPVSGPDINEVGTMFKNAEDECIIKIIRNGSLTKTLTLVKENSSNFLNICVSGNCKNGYGVFTDKDGNTMEGNWKEGLQEGKGQ